MKKAALIAGILGAVIIGSSITITQQNEYKLIRQFGKVDRVICEPGISFKIPLIERTQSLPKETLLYDLEASDVITKDKKTMISDSYVLWRITDPLKFAQTLNSSLENSESRINTAVYNATKNVISSLSQDLSLIHIYCLFLLLNLVSCIQSQSPCRYKPNSTDCQIFHFSISLTHFSPPSLLLTIVVKRSKREKKDFYPRHCYNA